MLLASLQLQPPVARPAPVKARDHPRPLTLRMLTLLHPRCLQTRYYLQNDVPVPERPWLLVSLRSGRPLRTHEGSDTSVFLQIDRCSVLRGLCNYLSIAWTEQHLRVRSEDVPIANRCASPCNDDGRIHICLIVPNLDGHTTLRPESAALAPRCLHFFADGGLQPRLFNRRV